MMRKYFINGYEVSSDMHTHAEGLIRAGGKAYLVVADKAQQGCSNCNGAGSLALQYIVGGPFDNIPPSSASNDTTISVSVIKGQIFQTKTKGYKCPVCGGASQVESQLKQTEYQADNSMVDDMRIKRNYRQGQRDLEREAIGEAA